MINRQPSADLEGLWIAGGVRPAWGLLVPDGAVRRVLGDVGDDVRAGGADGRAIHAGNGEGNDSGQGWCVGALHRFTFRFDKIAKEVLTLFMPVSNTAITNYIAMFDPLFTISWYMNIGNYLWISQILPPHSENV